MIFRYKKYSIYKGNRDYTGLYSGSFYLKYNCDYVIPINVKGSRISGQFNRCLSKKKWGINKTVNRVSTLYRNNRKKEKYHE